MANKRISDLPLVTSPTGGDVVPIDGATTRSITYQNLFAGLTANSGSPGGRVTLTSGASVTESDVTGAGTIYYTPASNNLIGIYDGANIISLSFAELSLALDNNAGHTGYHQSGKNFDVWAYAVAGVVTIGTGPAWTSDTARGTGAGTTEFEVFLGRVVNKNSITLRFGTVSGNTVAVAARQAVLIGTIRCTADGMTEDSVAKRFVSNAYNTIVRSLKRLETTASWTYSTAAWRQANGSASNQVDFVNCLSGRIARVCAKTVATTSAATNRTTLVGVGLDRTNGSDGIIQDVLCITGLTVGGAAMYEAYPGLGYHSLKWLEFGAGADTQTWFGASAYGMMGAVES